MKHHNPTQRSHPESEQVGVFVILEVTDLYSDRSEFDVQMTLCEGTVENDATIVCTANVHATKNDLVKYPPSIQAERTIYALDLLVKFTQLVLSIEKRMVHEIKTTGAR